MPHDQNTAQSTAAYSLNDFLRRYAISHSKAYREMRSGSLRARKLGRKTLIDVAEAERWWSEATRPATFITSK